MSFSADRLEASARRAVGLDDFGDPYYREGLDRLVASLDADADLNIVGRLFLRRVIRTALMNRLLLTAQRRARPDIHEAPLRPPLIITGLPRSGTTLLHRTLASAPEFFAPPYWLMARPFPRSPKDTEEARLAAAQREIWWRKSLVPWAAAKHKLSARRPEECIFALALTFHTTLYAILAQVDSYLRWYLAADRRRKYADYRAILLAIQAQRPGATLVLKAPDHLGGLADLVAAVPEAMVVQLHRNPVAVVSSLSSLVQSLRMGMSERHDPARLAATMADILETELRRNMAQRPRLPRPVVDIRYEDLAADPAGTAIGVFKAFGLPLPRGGRRRIANYVARHPQDRWGRHQYSAAEFGIDEAATATRFRFYSDAFGL